MQTEQDHAAAAEGAGDVESVLSVASEARKLGFSSCPQLPDPFEVDDAGVYVVKETRDGETTRVRVCWAPLLVVRVFADPAGQQLVELAWWARRRWVRCIVPRLAVASGKRLVLALGNAGLPVIESAAKGVEWWLAAFMTVNESRIPVERVARQLGWQPDGTFVTGQGAPYRVEPTYDDQRGALEAHRPAGLLSEWKRAVKLIGDHPVAGVILSTSFVPPLLGTLGLDSSIVDASSPSTRGKTTALMAATSVWADPSERAEGMFSWKSTELQFEKRLNLANGVPVAVDETQIANPDTIERALYQVAKNRGKARGGGYPSMLPWRTVVISTGERPALSFTTQQGAAARVLSLRGAPFGNDGQESADAANAVRDGVAAAYGSAGPAFVAKLVQLLKQPGASARLRERHGELASQLAGASDLSRRRAPMVAAVYLAAQLAYEFDVLPFEPAKIEAWRELLTGDEPTDNRPEMALDALREYAAAHPGEFRPAGRQQEAPIAGWSGRMVVHADKSADVCFLAQKARDILARADYSLDAVVSGWVESGAVTTQAKQRPPYLVMRSLGERSARMLEFVRLLEPHADE
ncbi:MAG: DUF927 domain-containing protein [Actinocrinis sp.]